MTNDEVTNLKSGENSNLSGISENTRLRLAAKTAKKEGVKKGVWTTLLFSFILLAAVGITGYSLYKC